ncbi:TetR/AcrR family transcriptional regulator [Diaminobutyricibacter sp. McL0608]|uniref:TetR/AcrR family transcriptional regulator n=1 Tax=Leifsonia sp. McL0608 TaxID=3143537 RepID=UPI0031F32B15
MSIESSPPAVRPLRKDAVRNRDTLLAVARSSFAAADDQVPLEDIARAAGVGIGTLYRHFPTRESLVEAVYSAELDDVTSSAQTLVEAFPPDVALDEWMKGYAEFVATKRGMLDTLRAGWASGRIATPTTRERITAAIGTILAAGAEAGVFRDDVVPDDVTALLVGVFLTNPTSGTSDQPARLRALLIDALRPRTR